MLQWNQLSHSLTITNSSAVLLVCIKASHARLEKRNHAVLLCGDGLNHLSLCCGLSENATRLCAVAEWTHFLDCPTKISHTSSPRAFRDTNFVPAITAFTLIVLLCKHWTVHPSWPSCDVKLFPSFSREETSGHVVMLMHVNQLLAWMSSYPLTFELSEQQQTCKCFSRC